MQPHNPIDHIVIIVKENHTFDNYFGTFPGANGIATLPHASDPLPHTGPIATPLSTQSQEGKSCFNPSSVNR